MKVNFDVLISGCNTRCRHCYVNGGPGALMPLETALIAFEKLDAISELLPYESSFTLDNEPMNHPDIGTIIRSAAGTEHCRCFHHGMTGGIALMRRKDRDAVMRTCLDCGFKEFGITIHGNEQHHDEIVRRQGAYKAAVGAAEFMKECGAGTGVSLMFNRFFAEDAGDIDALLARLEPDYIYFAVPNYTPHENMDGYEPFRGSTDTLLKIRPYLARWRQQEEELTKELCTISRVKEQLEQGLDIGELFRSPQDELYMTVHQDGNLFAGNTGVETECLGNVRTLDVRETAERILAMPGNRDYGAFYDMEMLPGSAELIRALDYLPGDLLYSDMASAIYRGLAALGVPVKILKC